MLGSKFPNKKIKKFALIAVAVLITITIFFFPNPVNAAEQDAEYWFNTGNDFFFIGDYHKAIEAYTKAIELDPNYVAAYLNRGEAYYYLGQHDKAIEDYSIAIDLEPNDAATYRQRGNIYLIWEQYDKAIEDYSKAIELYPTVLAYNNRGTAYFYLGQYDKAIADFSRAIDLDPDAANAYNNRGYVYYDLGQYDEAIEDYSKAIELDPNHADAYNNRGYVYYNLGQYDKAFEDLNRAIDLDPTVAGAYRRRGDIYYILGQYDKAIEDFSRAIDLDPNYTAAYRGRGEVYYELEQYGKAIEDYSIAIDLDPDDAATYQNREIAIKTLREIEAAMAEKLPFIILVSLLPLIGVAFKIRQNRKQRSKKGFRFIPIEAWKAYGLTIMYVMVFFWGGFWFLWTGPRLLTEGVRNIEDLALALASLAICIITVKILGGLFDRKELSKNLLYLNIAFSVSLALFILVSSGVDVILKDPEALIAIITPFFIPNLIGLYVTNKHGELLIVKGKEMRMPTTAVFPAELNQFYTDTEYIGGGGFAWVFRATRGDGTKVAVKIPAIKDEKTGKFFISEVSNWSALNHENIVKLNSFNIYPLPYLEMELCDGSLERGKRGVGEAAPIIYEVAKGLKHAHEKNIVHADIKHGNILITDGKIKISDWGLSKVKRGKSLSVSALTPEFAAPEQIVGKIDERTDIWQLGVVFYELVTGKFPFEGEYTEVINHLINDEPVPPSEINPDSKCVEHIIIKCLKKKKEEERYQSVDELIEELKEYLVESGQAETTHRISATLCCPHCGVEVGPEDAYCNGCGKPVQAQTSPLPTAQAKCPFCGFEIQSSDVFCLNCGKKIKE